MVQNKEKLNLFQHMKILIVILKGGIVEVLNGSLNKLLGFDKTSKDYQFF